jgi:hypothetical protein
MERIAYVGSARGSIVEFTPGGVWMRLACNGEIVFLVHQHLNPQGFRPACKPRTAPRARCAPTPTPKVSRGLRSAARGSK